MNIMNQNMEMLRKLQSNPREFIQKAGVDIPEEMMNDPKAMVMHLINTGQVKGQALQQVMPMIRQMGGR